MNSKPSLNPKPPLNSKASLDLKPSLKEIRTQLKALKHFSVVVYGSYATGQFTVRSDIDVAVITRKSQPKENKAIWGKVLGKAPDRYDLKVFELLPLEVKANIMDKYLVVFGDLLELSEYFYHFRKLWKDVEPRYRANQFTSLKEKLRALSLV